jgi:hypothetical protein
MTKQSVYVIVRRFAWLMIIFYCFRAVPLEIKSREKFREISRWPVTNAVVQSSGVSITSFSWSSRNSRFCPNIEYTYSIAGRTYTNRNQVFDLSCWPDAYNFVAKYGPGSPIVIAYDPTNPKTTVVPSSVVDTWLPWEDLLAGFIFLAVLATDLLATRGQSRA